MPESEALPFEPGWHVFTCPGCGEAVDVSADAVGKLAICPYCNTQFSPEEQDDEAADRLAHEHDLARRERELNTLRIRAVSTERRAVLRFRSYWIVLLVPMFVVPVKLFLWAIPLLQKHHRIQAIGYLLAAFALLSATRWPLRKIHALNQELNKPRLEEPTIPPDFSTLDNGSQRWKNLEQLSEGTIQ